VVLINKAANIHVRIGRSHVYAYSQIELPYMGIHNKVKDCGLSLFVCIDKFYLWIDEL